MPCRYVMTTFSISLYPKSDVKHFNALAALALVGEIPLPCCNKLFPLKLLFTTNGTTTTSCPASIQYQQ